MITRIGSWTWTLLDTLRAVIGPLPPPLTNALLPRPATSLSGLPSTVVVRDGRCVAVAVAAVVPRARLDGQTIRHLRA